LVSIDAASVRHRSNRRPLFVGMEPAFAAIGVGNHALGADGRKSARSCALVPADKHRKPTVGRATLLKLGFNVAQSSVAK